MDPATANPASPADAPAAATPAGFWRRTVAFAIDMMLLGVVFMVVGAFAFDALAALGGNEGAIGLVAATIYFALFDGPVGGGRSPGKRFAGVRVADHAGNPLSAARAATRYLILGVPFFVQSMPLPHWVQGPFVGTLFASAWLLAANRPSRRTLHDLATGAHVVANTPGVPVAAPVAAVHRIVAGAFVAVIAAYAVAMPLYFGDRFAQLDAVNDTLRQQADVASSSVMLSWREQNGTRTAFVAVDIRARRPTGFDALGRACATAVVAHVHEAGYDDFIECRFHYGYDVGIASAWKHGMLRYDAKTGEPLPETE